MRFPCMAVVAKTCFWPNEIRVDRYRELEGKVVCDAPTSEMAGARDLSSGCIEKLNAESIRLCNSQTNHTRVLYTDRTVKWLAGSSCALVGARRPKPCPIYKRRQAF
ncbi:hypothetical protein IF2G_09681 [Cordyceps javanica]|nr:hypothetical protein IF2G_09681 [Cordyceps javanica]